MPDCLTCRHCPGQSELQAHAGRRNQVPRVFHCNGGGIIQDIRQHVSDNPQYGARVERRRVTYEPIPEPRDNCPRWEDAHPEHPLRVVRAPGVGVTHLPLESLDAAQQVARASRPIAGRALASGRAGALVPVELGNFVNHSAGYDYQMVSPEELNQRIAEHLQQYVGSPIHQGSLGHITAAIRAQLPSDAQVRVTLEHDQLNVNVTLMEQAWTPSMTVSMNQTLRENVPLAVDWDLNAKGSGAEIRVGRQLPPPPRPVFKTRYQRVMEGMSR